MPTKDEKEQVKPRAKASGSAQGADGECCQHKQTPRSMELQEDLQKRLNRAIGQLNGVKRMIDDNRYCGDVLTQLAAVESAVKRISDLVLKEHLETCVSDRIKAGDASAIDEVMGLLRQHNG